jgi:hypothetical protein
MKENFYFKYNANKRLTNIKVADLKSPGNKHRHPSVALPHDHVHVQHYIDANISEEKYHEIFAYYSFLIDLHISQVRPQNLIEKQYIPAHFNKIETLYNREEDLNNMWFDFYHRWREPTRTWRS